MQQQNITVKTSVTKQIVFPKQLISQVQPKLDRLGINLPEYVRHLMIKDVENSIPELDEATEHSVKRAMDDVANNKTKTFDSIADFKKYIAQ